MCYCFKGCPWDNGRGRLCREISEGEVQGLVIREGPIDADELGQALRLVRGLRVLVFDGAQLTRSAAEHVARAVAGKAELRLLYMARTGISQAYI